MRALYEMARELSSALVLEQIEEIGDRFVSSTFGVHAHLLLPDDQGKLPVNLFARRGARPGHRAMGAGSRSSRRLRHRYPAGQPLSLCTR
jgi:K+-sensing histidine kinase KdpD